MSAAPPPPSRLRGVLLPLVGRIGVRRAAVPAGFSPDLPLAGAGHEVAHSARATAQLRTLEHAAALVTRASPASTNLRLAKVFDDLVGSVGSHELA